MLKRGYGGDKPVIAGAKGTIRDQVLPFVNENGRVSQKKLKRYIAGLNETSRRPVAAANMWLKRNAKYFVTESKGGEIFFKLSTVGKRLMNRVQPMMEAKKEGQKKGMKKNYDFKDNGKPGIIDKYDGDCDEMDEADTAGIEIGASSIEKYLKSKKKKMHKSSKWSNLLEKEDEEMDDEEDDDMNESIARKKRIAKLLEKIKAKEASKLNEEEEENMDSDEDELTFDDLDLGGDDEGEESDMDSGDDDGDVEDVEIAEFILTVDDPEAAIAELKALGITAEAVEEEESEDEMDSDDDDDLDFDSEEEEEEEEDDLDMELEEADESEEEIDLDLGDDSELDLNLGDDPEADIDMEDEDEGEDFIDVDMDGEDEGPAGQKIKVPAEHAEALVKWLEEKGVDVEEMFGGELEFEGDDDEDDEDFGDEEGEEDDED